MAERFPSYSSQRQAAGEMGATHRAFIGKSSLDTRAQVRNTDSNKRVNTFDRQSLKTKTQLENGQQNSASARQDRRQHREDQRLVDSYNQSQETYINQILAFDAYAGPESKSELPIKTKLAEYIKGKLDKLDKSEEVQGIVMSPLDIKSLVQENAKSLLNFAPESILILGPLAAAIWLFNNSPKEIRSAIKKTYDKVPVKFKLVFILLLCGGLLAACEAVAPTPTAELPNANAPTAAETAGAPGAATEQATEQAQPAETVDPLFDKVSTDINSNPNYANSYVKALEAENGESLIAACVEAANKFGDRISVPDNTFGINQYGICYAKSNDGSQIIFDKWDANGPLYVTRAAGFELLTKINPQETKGKTEQDYEVNENAANAFAVLTRSDGTLTEVGVGSNGQWGTTGSTEIIATPTADATDSQTDIPEENLLVSNKELVSSAVTDFLSGKSEFPNDWNEEQTSAFIDEWNLRTSSAVTDFLSGKSEFPNDWNEEQTSAFIDEWNLRRGKQPIYVEAVDKAGQPVVMYRDNTQNKMVTLPGTYEQNKAIIDQNSSETIYKISEEKDTGNIQFVDPATGELITVPNSNIDWNMVIDENNLNDGTINWPATGKKFVNNTITFAEAMIKGITRSKVKAVPAILYSNEPTTLVSEENGGAYFDHNFLRFLFVETDEETGKALYAFEAYVGPEGGALKLVEEGNENIEEIRLQTSDSEKKLKSGTVYYVALNPNQAQGWASFNHATIDPLENVSSASEVWTDPSQGPSPTEENSIFNSAFILGQK